MLGEYFTDITYGLMKGTDVSDKLRHFEIINDINIPIGIESPFATDRSQSPNLHGSIWIKSSIGSFSLNKGEKSIPLNKGDIIGMGSMRYTDIGLFHSDDKIRRINIIFFNDTKYQTTISKSFLEKNQFIFRDITIEFLRDKKISKILNNV